MGEAYQDLAGGLETATQQQGLDKHQVDALDYKRWLVTAEWCVVPALLSRERQARVLQHPYLPTAQRMAQR